MKNLAVPVFVALRIRLRANLLPFSFALVGAVLLPWSIPARAYSLENAYQSPKSAIGYCNGATGLNNQDYYSWQDAVAAWNSATSTVSFVASCNGNTITLYSYNNGADGASGYTTLNEVTSGSCSLSYLITHGNSRLNTYYTDTSTYTADARQAVGVHELGHELGLAHTPNTAAIMFPSDKFWFTYHHKTPQTDDLNGVNDIYVTDNCP